MRSIVFIALAIMQIHAHADELVCFTVSSITLNNMGQQIEHDVTDPDDLRDPENYTVFDLTDGTTTLFWSDSNGNKVREVDKLKMINALVYVGEYEVRSEIQFTIYLFENDFSGGLLTEVGFVASFRCERIGLTAAEEKYSIPFSEFVETD